MQGESKVAILLSHKQICRSLWARRGRARRGRREERGRGRYGGGCMGEGDTEREEREGVGKYSLVSISDSSVY